MIPFTSSQSLRINDLYFFCLFFINMGFFSPKISL
jgi:hypothetical protein